MIPSIYGACAPETSLLRAKVEAGGRRAFTLLRNDAGLPLRGTDHFLYLEISDRTLATFSLTLRYSGGQEETIPLTHSTWAPMSGRFFLELSGRLPGQLESATLEAERGVAGPIRTRVCRLPQ